MLIKICVTDFDNYNVCITPNKIVMKINPSKCHFFVGPYVTLPGWNDRFWMRSTQSKLPNKKQSNNTNTHGRE